MKKIFMLGLVVLLSGVSFIGCSQSGNQGSTKQGETKEEESKSTNGKASISVIGSTSVQPLLDELAEKYNEKNKNVNIDVQGIGSTAGILAANDGKAEIGMTSRNLKDAEKAWKLTEHIIANECIAVVVNKNNPLTELTKEKVTEVFQGKIKNWKELGGNDEEIIVVSREAGSGTRGAFDEMLKIEIEKEGKKVSTLRTDALIAEGNGAIKTNIKDKNNAIGYMSFGFVDENVKALKISGVEPSVENTKSGKYSIARPFILLTKGEIKQETNKFLEFIKGEEGQKIVAEKYISIK